jgi:hypothetical protein
MADDAVIVLDPVNRPVAAKDAGRQVAASRA